MMSIIDTGSDTAEANMRFDEKLLDTLDPDGVPLLHFYRWEGLSATYGHFTKPEKHLSLSVAEEKGLKLAKRPTGGGIVFHIWDFAFSFLMPANHQLCSLNTLTNYEFVNASVLEIMKEFVGPIPLELIAESALALGPNCSHFCMARPTQYDVVYQGKKIAGAAQRRTKRGYLHQGTISLAFPDLEFLSHVLLSQEEIVQAMNACTLAPLGKGASLKELEAMRHLIQEKLTQNFMEKITRSQ